MDFLGAVRSFVVLNLKNIYISIFFREVRCAYFLGKMVEMASFKRERIRFHNYSTSLCGFLRKSLLKPNFLEK
jgi:hypothetical protein